MGGTATGFRTTLGRSPLRALALSTALAVLLGLTSWTAPAALAAAPAITSIFPNAGSPLGGTTVEIVGSGFLAVPGITDIAIGASSVGYTVESDTLITAVTPSAAGGGPVDVTVTSDDGDASVLANGFTYTYEPAINAVSPSLGPVAGGTVVTISGANLADVSSVTFDGVAAAAIASNPAGTAITATTPAHPGAGYVDVAVTDPLGSTTKADAFRYAGVPTISGVSPNAGPSSGGTVVTITGEDLLGASVVTFGGTPAADVFVASANEVQVTTPAHALGSVDVAITTPGGMSTTGSGAFTYNDLSSAGGNTSGSAGGGASSSVIQEVRPAFGPVTGGTRIQILGYGFWGATAVSIGGIPATNFRWIDAATLEVTTPSGSAGWQPLVVRLPNGSTAATFRYVAATGTAVEPQAATVIPALNASVAFKAGSAKLTATAKAILRDLIASIPASASPSSITSGLVNASHATKKATKLAKARAKAVAAFLAANGLKGTNTSAAKKIPAPGKKVPRQVIVTVTY